MAFEFQYHGLRYAKLELYGVCTMLLGKVTRGRIEPGNRISIPLKDGASFVTNVAGFYDDLFDWLGMPFYYRVDGSIASPFALVLSGQPTENNAICPGIASSPEKLDPQMKIPPSAGANSI